MLFSTCQNHYRVIALPIRILFLCPQPLWPTNTGARLRTFHLANALTKDCQVTILQITQPSDKPAPESPSGFQKVISATRGKGYTPAKILKGLAGPLPVTVLNYSSANVEEILSRTLESTPFDFVQIESIHLFRYFETIRKSKSSPAVVLDWHNIESELMQRYAAGEPNPAKKFIASRTAKLLEKLEENALQSFDAHTVVSEREQEKLRARNPTAAIHVIPNGVDITSFEDHSNNTPAARPTVLFVGSMDYHANSDAILWFCAEIWPQIAAEYPALDFKIVGRNPPASVQALASSRIFVTGTVDDVRPFYRQAFAVVVPLRIGGGTRLKILEAMAAGVPVISTRLGAEGLNANDHEQILLAENAAEFSACIRSLLANPEYALKLRSAALNLVTGHYNWAVLGQKLVNVYKSLQK